MKKFFGSWLCGLVVLGSVGLFTSSCGGTVKDIDGNVYKTVKIGNQRWMAENLRVTKFSNGDPIETTEDKNQDISEIFEPKLQWFAGGNENYPESYGRLYTWYVVTDSRNICPKGWRVITDKEWSKLSNYFGGPATAGGALKEAGAENWQSPNTSATNGSGFTALAAGGRSSKGAFGGVGYYGAWWSPTNISDEAAPYWHLYYNTAAVKKTDYHKNSAFSVRCVRDL